MAPSVTVIVRFPGFWARSPGLFSACADVFTRLGNIIGQGLATIIDKCLQVPGPRRDGVSIVQSPKLMRSLALRKDDCPLFSCHPAPVRLRDTGVCLPASSRRNGKGRFPGRFSVFLGDGMPQGVVSDSRDVWRSLNRGGGASICRSRCRVRTQLDAGVK